MHILQGGSVALFFENVERSGIEGGTEVILSVSSSDTVPSGNCLQFTVPLAL